MYRGRIPKRQDYIAAWTSQEMAVHKRYQPLNGGYGNHIKGVFGCKSWFHNRRARCPAELKDQMGNEQSADSRTVR